jgi:phage tail-like protein
VRSHSRPRNADTSRAGSRFALDIDGTSAGWIQDTEGGNATAAVVNEKVGSDQLVHKHLANVKYEQIAVTAGFAMGKHFYDWIAASWNMNYARKNGAVVAADFQGEATQKREYFNALITETQIPACDASSKEPAYLTIRFAPEYTRTVKASGKVAVNETKGQKLWLPSNFKLEIDGLDCTRVNKIDSFTIKQSIVESSTGEQRDYDLSPASTEFPNLRITFGAASGESWMDWYKEFVVNGNNGSDKEKSGRLTFLSPNRGDALARIDFFGMGIFKLEDGVFDPVNEPSATMRAELYVERMQFVMGGVAPS